MSKKTFIKRKAIKKRKGIKKRKTVKNYRKYKKGGAMPSTQTNVVASNVGSTLNTPQPPNVQNMNNHDLHSLQNLLNDYASKGLLNDSNKVVMEKLTNTYKAYNGTSQSFFGTMIQKILP